MEYVGNNARLASDRVTANRRNETINDDNKMELVEQASVVNCKTTYQGKLVHRQYLTRNLPPARRAARANQVEQSNANDAEQQQLMNPQINDIDIQNSAPRQTASPVQQQRRNP